MSPFIIPLSNIDRQAVAPVATHPGIGISGAYDMAGNVREWCLNSSGSGRYVLGGAWSDRVYGFTEAAIQLPWDRLPGRQQDSGVQRPRASRSLARSL